MYLMQYYHDHNLMARTVDPDLKATIQINDGKGHNLKRLSSELAVDYSILQLLNPQFINGQFPKNNQTLYLNIPVSRHERYLEVHQKEAYKLLLEERRNAELLEMKERKAKQQRILKQKAIVSPLEPIEQILYRKLKQQHRQRKYYRVRFSKPV